MKTDEGRYLLQRPECLPAG